MTVDIREDLLTPYRLRTVRIGVTATFFVLAVVVAFALLPGHPAIDTVPFVTVLSVGTALAVVVAVLPWERLFRTGVGMRVMYLWSMGDILLISLLIRSAPGAEPGLFFLYAFTTVFWAASYPRRGQIGLLAFTFACYLAVLGVLGWPLGIPAIILRLGLLGALAYMADFLSSELRGQTAAHHVARAESEQRATLLAVVARAARNLQDLDTERVLPAIVDSALALGFEAGNLALFSEDLATYAVVHGRNLPEEYLTGVHAADTGMPALVRAERRTVVVDDYERHPKAVPMLRQLGYHAVIASPIWVQGKLSAALVAGSKERRELSAQDVEAFELLAALAGRAMENAQRFEDERRTVERLAEIDRLKSEFVSTVSHELRTPLTAIVGMGITLERQWERMDDATRREFLGRLNANARSLEGIVSTLLDFSRLDSGRIEARKQRVRLDALASDVVGRLQGMLDRHPVGVEVEEATTVGDPVLLERVVENLLTNAIKHTPPGTRVRVSVRTEGDDVVTEVADEGPGIPEADLRHLGNRFFRGGAANTRATRGTGLGLALVRELLELHGASLQVWSELGQGSRFWFALPVASQPAEPPSLRETDRRPA